MRRSLGKDGSVVKQWQKRTGEEGKRGTGKRGPQRPLPLYPFPFALEKCSQPPGSRFQVLEPSEISTP